MSEAITVARPYANAIFKLAKEQNAYEAWSDMLETCAMIAADKDMIGLMDNPHISAEQLTSLVTDIAGDRLTDQGKNFVHLLSENNRLNLLVDIAAIYALMRNEVESIVHATVTSAFDITEEQKTVIIESLKKRFNKNVELVCETDSSLMGGVVIRAGDLIIDGSVKGRLVKLATTLTH